VEHHRQSGRRTQERPSATISEAVAGTYPDAIAQVKVA
jgi:hypothetical protein